MMRRLSLTLLPLALIVAMGVACTPTVPPPIINYTCYASPTGQLDIASTPIAGFSFGVKNNGLSFSSQNGTCTGNTVQITFVQVNPPIDPVSDHTNAAAQCVGLGYIDADQLHYTGLPPAVYECV
jgi:hypothetical protein